MEILAERLLKLRSERKLSRREVAASTHMTERTYQRYENAERDPSAPALLALADFYGVSADYLLGRVDGPSTMPIARDEMSVGEFDAMMEAGLAQAQAGQGVSLEECFR